MRHVKWVVKGDFLIIVVQADADPVWFAFHTESSPGFCAGTVLFTFS